MAGYKWLAERKAQAMKEKLIRRGLPSYQQLAMSERYGVSFTGYGRNGRLDPRAPAEIDVSTGEPIELHEGETKATLPEGTLVIDARTTKMAGMTPEEERAEQMYSTEGNLPELACGGFMKRRYTGGFSPRLAGSIRPLADATAMKVDESMEGYQAGGFARSMPVPINQPTPATNQAVPQTNLTNPQFGTSMPVPITGPGATPTQPTITTTPTPTPQIQAPQMQMPTIQRPTAQPLQFPTLAGQQRQQVTAPTPAMPQVPTPAPQPLQFPALAGQQIPTPAVPPTPEVPEETPEERARTTAMDYLLRSLTAEDSPLSAEGRRATSELATRQQQERSALQQRLIQQGADPGRARTELMMLRNQQEGELNDLAAQYGISLQKQRTAIAQQLAPEALTGMRFEEEKRQTELQNQLNQADLLLSAGGEGNIQQAANIYNEAYPGLGIDFTKVITADKAGTFNEGINSLSSYVAAGLDYNEALAAMKADGTFDMLGMDENQVEAFYNAMSTNVIDEQWERWSESKMFQSLTPEEQADQREFFIGMLTGQIDYDISYDVRDASGNVLQSFQTRAEADAFSAEKPGTRVVSNIVPKEAITPAVPATVGEGATTGGEIRAEDVPKKTDGSDYEQGEYFTQGGFLYKVGTDGTGIRADTIPDDVTGRDARAILDAGREGNPLYDLLIDTVRQEAEDGLLTYEDVEGLEQEHPIYQAVLAGTPATTYSTLWSIEGENYKGRLVKINIPGMGEVLARFIGTWNSGNYITQETPDGTQYRIENAGEAFRLTNGKQVNYHSGKYIKDGAYPKRPEGFVVMDGYLIR